MGRIFNHPVWLTGSKAEQQAEAQRQEIARASFTRAKLTDAERLIGRGRLIEETARGNLAEAKKARSKAARIHAENQLADGLAMQGKYPEAVETHNDPKRRKHFRKIIKAIEKSDNARCQCRSKREKAAGAIEHPSALVFSPKHGRIVQLVECLGCGDLNAK